MLGNFFEIFRKRRRCDDGDEVVGNVPLPSERPDAHDDSELVNEFCTNNNNNTQIDREICANSNQTHTQSLRHKKNKKSNRQKKLNSVEDKFNRTPDQRLKTYFTLDQPQEMDIDVPTVHPSENHHHHHHHHHQPSNNSSALSSSAANVYHSESSMNFDYLQGLQAGSHLASSSSSAVGGGNGGGVSANSSYGLVDDSRAMDRPFNANERFVSIMDQLDARVERFRKDALNLQEKKDYLLMSMDLIKSNEMLQNMNEAEREEIMLYIQRVSSRLGTVELNVRTVRDNSQEDSLSQINALIDTMIKMGDPVIARQRCQLYLNACCSSTMDPFGHMDAVPESDLGPIDKKFESALLGCTLDDQKT